MATGNEPVSDSLLQRIEDLARQQSREPAEVLEEAFNRYAALCRLDRFSEKMEARARSLGIEEKDVPELVQQVRRENGR
jgi:predicted transcriptional regulator